MKKILELERLVSGVIGAFALIIIGGVILGLIEFAMWLFNYQSPGLCCLLVLGVIGFILGLVAYLDNYNK